MVRLCNSVSVQLFAELTWRDSPYLPLRFGIQFLENIQNQVSGRWEVDASCSSEDLVANGNDGASFARPLSPLKHHTAEHNLDLLVAKRPDTEMDRSLCELSGTQQLL